MTALPTTVLNDFVAILRHHGVQTTPEALSSRHGLSGRTLTFSTLARMAGDMGFFAARKRLPPPGGCWIWAKSYPALAKPATAARPCLSGVRTSPDGEAQLVLYDLRAAPGTSLFVFLSPGDIAGRFTGELLGGKNAWTQATPNISAWAGFCPRWPGKNASSSRSRPSPFSCTAWPSPCRFFQAVVDKVWPTTSWRRSTSWPSA